MLNNLPLRRGSQMTICFFFSPFISFFVSAAPMKIWSEQEVLITASRDGLWYHPGMPECFFKILT